MDKEKIIQEIVELPTETRVKAYLMEVNGSFFQIAEYSGYKVGDKTSVWKADKKGKRTDDNPVFTITTKNWKRCVEQFLEKMGAEEQS
jgi:hypothetical protein